MRRVQFQNDYYYHIFNRGVDKRNVFMDDKDFIRFLKNLREFNNNLKHGQRIYLKNKYLEARELSSEASELSSAGLNFSNFIKHNYPELSSERDLKLVDIICYCLNPNHFHLLLKQKTEKGIEKFMHKLSLGYTNYFNQKYNRSGSLFQGTYRAVPVKKHSHFLKLAVYINCNSEVHGICLAVAWPWSSYRDYIGHRQGTLCSKNVILEEFKNYNEFKNFCKQVLPDLKEIKQYLLE